MRLRRTLWLLLVLADRAHAQPTTNPPELIEAPPVVLPADVDALPENAAVVLELTIEPTGEVRQAAIVESLRADADAAAVEAAARMRFRPATRDGRPVAARIRFRYRITRAEAAVDDSNRANSGTAADSVVRSDANDDAANDDAANDDAANDDAANDDAANDAAHDDAASDDAASDAANDDAASETEGEPALGVTASVDRREEGAASRITLRGAELTTVPGTFGEPLRAVASLPGVARSPFGLGFFLVRGSDFQNTGFLVDGFPVPLLYHLGAGPAILSNSLVDRMHFYAGNYPVRYGRFGGGLIAVETRAPELEGPIGELSIDAVRASAFAATPFDDGKGVVGAAFRRSYFEAILPLIAPGLELSITDYQAIANYRASDRLTLSLLFFGADDRLDQSGRLGDGALLSDGSRSAAAFDLQRLITTVRIRLPSGPRLSLSGMLGRDASAFDTAQPGFGLLRFAIEAFFAGLRFETFVPWSDHLRTSFGIDVNTLHARVLGTAPLPSGLGEVPRPLPTIATSEEDLIVVEAFAAAYVEQVFDFAPFELSAGLRVDVMRYGDRLEPIVDPRAVARVRVAEWITLKAASGAFVQQPSPFTIFRVGGNPDIAPERSWQNSVGIELTLPFGLEADLTGFYNRQWQIARGVDEIVPTQDGLRRVFFRDDGEGHAWGLEAMLRARIEGFYGWLTYTLSRSERWHPGAPPTVFPFDQTHVVNLVASYGFDGWRFGARFQLATGRPVAPVDAARLDADTGGYTAIRGGLDERLPYSHQLDVRIDRDFTIGPVRGSVFLDVANVYFSDLPEGRLYQYDYARSALLRGLPIIPTLGIRGALQ